ncbi:glycosyl transferase [Amphritea opalescens]|uniref:Peptide O-xylosyltransferase n=1 Tax=Amphritea opalescens TaxID=2490544 RepID=A0A430KUL3_9GAMM|nr:beta-1,6-N-acetylglucosaminyltransferase [Amphritea opalescens]RTE67156.1 glycosyl transferase [Amphritea opalescens]
MKYNHQHAYLIMAHQHQDLLIKLLLSLDDPRNDIYIHIDTKSDINTEIITKKIKHSKCYFIDRTSVNWGGASQIKTELSLLEQATTKKNYVYYHLISGVCIPIKTQEKIHEFFMKKNGLQFVSFDPVANENKLFIDRVKYYHFFQDLFGRTNNRLIKKLKKLSLSIQKTLKIDRTKNHNEIYSKGDSWFSITNSFACHLVANKEKILRSYRFTYCADEIFLHTELIKNLDKFKIAEKNYRLIDWKRGGPYTFKIEDLSLICDSDSLFARKFNPDIDNEIIESLFNIN